MCNNNNSFSRARGDSKCLQKIYQEKVKLTATHIMAVSDPISYRNVFRMNSVAGKRSQDANT